MKVRTAVPVAMSLVVAAGALAPAIAAPKAKPKPITASYVAEGIPVPSPIVGEPAEASDSCINPDLEGVSTTTRTIKTLGAGTLEVGLAGFAGDWDITILDADGEVLAIGAGTTTGGEAPVIGGGNGSLGTDNVEKAILKVRKASTLQIAVCNYLGGQTANAKYTFTYK